MTIPFSNAVARRLLPWVLACMTLLAGPAPAATYTIIERNASNGSCSGGPETFQCTTVQAAVAAANATADDDTIVFDGSVFADAASASTLAGSGGLVVNAGVATGGRLTIDGTRGDGGHVRLVGQSSRVLTVYADADVTLRRLDLAQGLLTAIGGFLQGGAIHNAGTLRLQHGQVINSTVNAGNSQGGGIYNAGQMVLEHVTVAGNQVKNGAGYGGGIYNTGTLGLEYSTVSGNTADGEGGGIYSAQGATLTLLNSTVSGNAAVQQSGDGISSHGTTTLHHATLFGNAGQGLYVVRGVTRIESSIIGSGGCTLLPGYGGMIHASDSLIQNGMGCVNGTAANNFSGDPLLDPLADNGGETRTHLPQAASPLLDRAAACTGTDQRGMARPRGTGCDIGAVERPQHLLSVAVTGAGQVDAETTPAPTGDSIAACTAEGGLCGQGHDAQDGQSYTISLVATPAEGWRMGQWGADCQADGTDPLRATVSLDANRLCEARFDINQYTVSFDVQGGEPVAAITADYQSQIILPSAIRDGHVFLSWNTAPDGSGASHAAGDGFTLPAADLTLHAQWDANTRYLVTTPADHPDGLCTVVAPGMAECDTLRAALQAANASVANDRIVFAPEVFASPAASSVTLSEGELVARDAALAGSLDIDGLRGDGGTVAVNAAQASRGLRIEAGAVVRVRALDLVDGSAAAGAGLLNAGTLEFSHGTVAGNASTGTGGGIENQGTLFLHHATLTDNLAVNGAAIANFGVLQLSDSTLSGNLAEQYGGGIDNQGELVLSHATLADNHAYWGGGASLRAGTATLSGSLLALNTASYGDNCYAQPGIALDDAGHNLDDGEGCGLDHADSIRNGHAALGPLQVQGGNTAVHLPEPDSAAIDAAGDCAASHPDDQRGVARAQGVSCDIGAVERQPVALFADGFE